MLEYTKSTQLPTYRTFKRKKSKMRGQTKFYHQFRWQKNRANKKKAG